MRRLSFSVIVLVSAVFTCFGQEAKIGEVLPAWQEGELDIHFINTGHGECHWLIFPDGTTFLVDTPGSMTRKFGEGKAGPAEWRPNDVASPGQTVVNYINHFSPTISRGHINYFLLTHHHKDNMGEIKKDTPWNKNNLFKLSSVCEIGSLLVMDKIFDRDPDFSFPKVSTDEIMTNYQDFLHWTKRKNKSKIEKWAVGSSKQVVPLHDKSYDFTILNIAGNGCCCTGDEEGFVSYAPAKQLFDVMGKDAVPDENTFSCAYMLSYGKFDFFAGGDLQYEGRDKYSYKDAETPLVSVVHKVEVMKANNNGANGANSFELLNKLAPDVWVVGVWREIWNPDTGATKNMFKANPNVEVFTLSQSNENLGRLVSKLGLEEVDRHMVDQHGHIVIRVAKGGDSYMIYTLVDTDEEYRVGSIHGPYVCGG